MTATDTPAIDNDVADKINRIAANLGVDEVMAAAARAHLIKIGEIPLDEPGETDALEGLADPAGELKVGTPGAFVSLTNAEAKIEVGESKILATVDTEAKGTLKGAKVELDFEGEIHMNAPSVEYQRST